MKDNRENKIRIKDVNYTSEKVLKISLIILFCIVVLGSIYVYFKINSVDKINLP